MHRLHLAKRRDPPPLAPGSELRRRPRTAEYLNAVLADGDQEEVMVTLRYLE